MFFIFKIFPDWIWWILPVLGLLGLFLSQLPSAKTYELVFKILSYTTIATGIFILGMLYSDNTWNSAARDLKAKVVEVQAKSEVINSEVKERLVTKTQVVKVRGRDIIQYVDREVTPTDAGCKVSSEFVSAHNQAAEQPK